MTTNNRTSPSPPSPLEAELYYAGLPSAPLLVARTSTTPWKAPTGPEAYRQPKELRPVGKHAITEVWKDLGPKVFSLLDSMKVKWTSIDVIRIVNAGEPSVSAPVIVWIGVVPASLSGSDGIAVACKCRGLLEEHRIVDVDVEICESVVTRW